MAYSHQCITCGKGYNSCDSCRNVKSFTPWRTIACSGECFQLYMLIRACQKDEDDLEARAQLRELARRINVKESVRLEIRRLLKRRK